MRAAGWRGAAAHATAELAAWLALPAVFLAFYTALPYVPAAAVLPHLAVALVVWLALAVARMVLFMLIPAKALRCAASAALIAALLLLALAYYVLVIAGLRSWGRVPSADLIRTYALQAPALADALDVSVAAVAAAVLLAYAVLLGAVWRLLDRFDWIGALGAALSSRRYVVVVVTAATLCAVPLLLFRLYPPTGSAEPLSLTLFPGKAAYNLEGHAIDHLRAERLDHREDAARETYTVSAHAMRRNVVLIVVDALRADHMGVLGYARDTTPVLSGLARTGRVRGLQMRASCSSSGCGTMSLLASKFVHEFSERPITLHEVLKRHGYRVDLMLSGDHTNLHGLKHAYGAVDSYYDNAERAYFNDDRYVLDRAAALPPWDGTPAMLHFHLMSAHPMGLRQPEFVRYTPAATYVLPGRRDPQSAANYYDNGVLQADAFIGDLLRTLEAKGYLRDALVAITADHGEALGERGRYVHAYGLDEEVLRIPLLLAAYGYEARPLANNAMAAQVDVAPTVLAELGMNRPATWSGSALQAPFTRDYTYLQELDTIGLVDHRDPRNVWKYWVDGRSGREFAANLSRDPAQAAYDIAAAPLALRREWRRRYLELVHGATVIADDRPPNGY